MTWYYVRVLPSKEASVVKQAIREVVNEINHSFRLPAVWGIHSDRGVEFMAATVRSECQRLGLHCSATPGYDPNNNGRAERGIDIVKDLGRRLLGDAGLSSRWWGHAVAHATVLHRLRAQQRDIPESLPCFGSSVTALVRQRPRDDFAPRGYIGRYLGAAAETPTGGGNYAGYIERPDAVVEANGTFHRTQLDEYSMFPGIPAVEKEKPQEWELAEVAPICAACRGRPQPHTRVKGECTEAPNDGEEEAYDWFLQGEVCEECQPEDGADTEEKRLMNTSALASEAERRGWRISRITEAVPLHGQFAADLFEEALQCALNGGQVFVWWSLPCTPWTAWQRINQLRGVQLDEARAESLRMLETFDEVMTQLVELGAEMAFEWPRMCDGWKQEVPQKWLNTTGVHVANPDGCMLGVRCVTSGLPLYKPWRVMTTCIGRDSHECSVALIDTLTSASLSVAGLSENADDDAVLKRVLDEMKASGLQPWTAEQVRQSVGAERELWREALKSELESLQMLGVVKLVPSEVVRKISGRLIFPSKAVLGVKPSKPGQPRRYKARCCVCGNFAERDGGQSLSTTQIDATTIRLIAARAELHGLTLRGFDVATAFLRGEFPKDHNDFKLLPVETVWELERPLYGLREAPRCWAATRDRVLRELNAPGLELQQSVLDSSIWMVLKGGLLVGLLGTYVDDYLLAAMDGDSEILIRALRKVWEIKETGSVKPGERGELVFTGVSMVHGETSRWLFVSSSEGIRGGLARKVEHVSMQSLQGYGGGRVIC
eukprot:6103566-Amphidinium_carterae.1